MVEVKMLYEQDAYYFLLDPEHTMLKAAEAWLKVLTLCILKIFWNTEYLRVSHTAQEGKIRED